jgi:serine/threonine-protein phosphatase 2A regulatory subunit B''
MGYEDFVVFLISEVDKTSPTAVDYWFQCVDLDSDGFVASYELQYFFMEQKQRMQALSQEEVLFADIMCQLVDMVHPDDQHRFTKKDILRTKMGPLFFNVLFNMNKYLHYEHRDPVAIKKVHANPQWTDWDRYAIDGYIALAEVDSEEPAEEVAELEDGEDWQMRDGFGQFDVDDHNMDGLH